jgi:ribA/ribD-fused uncharacterized protein
MINSFSGEYSWLSNFYVKPFPFEGLIYPSAEHAYVSGKSTLPQWKTICSYSILTPADVKKLGGIVTLRPDWESIKLDHMYNVLLAKFSDPELKSKLLNTGHTLLFEGNYWGDIYWGKSLVTRFFKKHNRIIQTGEGENHLGNLLMKIR